MKFPRSFYEQEDVVEIAKALLGQQLCSNIDDQFTSGIITEVEAYAGRNDKACHANNNLRTPRTEIMYGQGGHSYVYLCYGIHHLFNVVTNRKDWADAVLIRAIEPLEGIEIMRLRRSKAKVDKTLTSGPGSMSRALGIQTKEHNGLDLLGDKIWIEKTREISAEELITSTRVGVDYAGEDAFKPWRFYLKDSKWISKK